MKAKRKVKKNEPDFLILIATTALVFIGIIMVYSASWPEGMVRFSNGGHYANRHIFWAIVGFSGMIVMMNIDYKVWKRFAPYIYILAIILGLLIFSPMGLELKGARRWINLGFTTFMPSDAIKLGSIIFFASFLANKKDKVRNLLNGALPAFFYIGLSSALIYLQKDLGTMIVMAGTMIAMFFVSGMHLSLIAGIGAFGYFFFQYAINSEGNEYRLRRVFIFQDPFQDKLGDGWQLAQSLYALGSGGVLGVGLGQSRQKFFYIPESYNDFIFSIIGEELGLIGALFILLLYTILIYRGVMTALNAKDLFGSYLATGITALITIQSLVNIAVVTSSIPATGITLPLISFGGTSLVFVMAGIGILLNISRHGIRKERSVQDESNS